MFTLDQLLLQYQRNASFTRNLATHRTENTKQKKTRMSEPWAESDRVRIMTHAVLDRKKTQPFQTYRVQSTAALLYEQKKIVQMGQVNQFC